MIKKRLGKQRVEANQIISILKQRNWFIKYIQEEKQGKSTNKRRQGETNTSENTPFILYKETQGKTTIGEENVPITEIYREWKARTGKFIFYNKEERKYIVSAKNDANGVEILRGFANHPAVSMWNGYLDALKMYLNFCIKEWTSRKCKDGSPCKNTISFQKVNTSSVSVPWWLTEEKQRLTQSHQAAMIRKEIARNENEWYVKLWSEGKIGCEMKYDDFGYFWPHSGTFASHQDDYFVILTHPEKKNLYESLLTFCV